MGTFALGALCGFLIVSQSMPPERTTTDLVAIYTLGGLLVVGLTLGFLRSLRASVVEFGAREVEIRGLFRTRRLAYNTIREAEVTQGSSAFLSDWRVPGFVLTTGKLVRADEIRSLRADTIVDEVVAEAKRRLG
jgi:hypothetical protein